MAGDLRKELRLLFEKYGSDKSRHGYQSVYAEVLGQHRERACNVVEVGVQEGKSLAAWLEFFPNAFVYGLDLAPPAVSSGRRFCVLQCDQASVHQLEAAAARIKTAGVVIDDGSHVPDHQLLTFNLFFSRVLEVGGVYIIEDVETSYWRKGELYGTSIRAGEESKASVINIFTNAIHRTVNGLYAGRDDVVGISKEAAEHIESMSFGKNYIMIRKGARRPPSGEVAPYYYANFVRGAT